jgi:hypothetical protein
VGDDPPSADPSGPVPAPVDAEVAAATTAPETSGSIDVDLSGPKLTHTSGSIEVASFEPSSSGSIDVALSAPTLLPPKLPDAAAPIEDASALDSAPVSSGRVTSMTVAVTGPTEAAHGKRGSSQRITEVKELLGRGVETIGSGLETIGEGVSKLGDVSKKVPLVGSGVAKLGEGITSVGESITDLPRVAKTRRGRLLVRSVFVGFSLVFVWIAAIVLLQTRRTDAPDFRPHAERILVSLSKGRAAIEEEYEKASPRFQEMVRKERFVDEMLDLNATAGKFLEITSVNETLVTRGPGGRVGRMSLGVAYAKGNTRAAVSLHWDDDHWKLLGISIEVPPDVTITQAEREERVAACKDPMDSKRCDVHIAANQILEQLRDGQASNVWDKASDVFQKQEQKARFIQIQAEHQRVLGEYRRIIAVTEAKVIGGTRGSYDVLVEYGRANVRAIFGFIRVSKNDPWMLRSLKVVLPMPRIDDLTRDAYPPSAGSGSADGSGSSSIGSGSEKPGTGSGSAKPATGSGSAKPATGSRPRPRPAKPPAAGSGSGSGSAAATGSGSAAP